MKNNKAYFKRKLLSFSKLKINNIKLHQIADLNLKS